jgi:hypothetical protein
VAQNALESITEDLRVPGVRFSGVESSVRRALQIVRDDSAKVLADVPAANKAKAAAELEKLKTALQEFAVVVANKDKQEVPYKQQECLNLVGAVEELMVNGARARAGIKREPPRTPGPNAPRAVPGFPFDIPAPYDTLPALKGRAEVEMTFKLAEGRASNPNQKRGTLTVVLDGYNAPVSAGNFVDLVLRKFYDGMEVQRSDGFVVQSVRTGAERQCRRVACLRAGCFFLACAVHAHHTRRLTRMPAVFAGRPAWAGGRLRGPVDAQAAQGAA